MGLKYSRSALNSLFRPKDDGELLLALSLPPGTVRALLIMPSLVIPNTQNMPALTPNFAILSHHWIALWSPFTS